MQVSTLPRNMGYCSWGNFAARNSRAEGTEVIVMTLIFLASDLLADELFCCSSGVDIAADSRGSRCLLLTEGFPPGLLEILVLARQTLQRAYSELHCYQFPLQSTLPVHQRKCDLFSRFRVLVPRTQLMVK